MLYLDKTSKKFTYDVGYPSDNIVTFEDDTLLRFACSLEAGAPVAILYADNWMETEYSVFFDKNGALMRSDSQPPSILSNVTVTATTTTISGKFSKGIKSIQANAAFMDFSGDAPTLTEVESASGRALSVEGYENDDDAFVSNALTVTNLDTKHFTLTSDKTIQSFSGRSNREVFRFKMLEPDERITLDDDGCIDFTQSGVDYVEIIANETEAITSKTDSITFSGSKMLARLGDLGTPDGVTLRLAFILYLDGDDKGVVLTASEMSPSASAQSFKPTLRQVS